MVMLTVHSALDAVWFLARIGGALAAQGIACNVVSGFTTIICLWRRPD